MIMTKYWPLWYFSIKKIWWYRLLWFHYHGITIISIYCPTLCYDALKFWKPTAGFLSDSQTENPNFFNWNITFINYCNGASFLGCETYLIGSSHYLHLSHNLSSPPPCSWIPPHIYPMFPFDTSATNSPLVPILKWKSDLLFSVYSITIWMNKSYITSHWL